ncbi:MAG: glycoside hydrolase N-terminal domain-containing protein, partial [Kiritimatiellales bacterium]
MKLLPTISLLLLTCVLQAQELPQRGVVSSVPADRWDNGLLTGNGRMGAVVYGQPTNETIIVNHEKLFLPTSEREGVLPDLSKYLSEVRRIIREESAKESYKATSVVMDAKVLPNRLPRAMTYEPADAFLQSKAKGDGLVVSPVAPYHPGFEFKIDMPAHGPVKNYLRTTDFETGEVTVRWDDDQGGYVRRLFVSKPDNAVVLSVKGPGAGALNCKLSAPALGQKLILSSQNTDQEWITFHNAYVNGKGGYDVVIRVVPKGGRVETEGGKIIFSQADEVLVLMKIEPFGTPFAGGREGSESSSVEHLKDTLRRLPTNYSALLQPHAKEHGALFNRVRLDLGASNEERALTSEKLFNQAQAMGYKQIPAALLEKLYDACRFYFITSAGELPPNLQGIWNGDWKPAWASDYHLDINLEMAMDSALSANMAEGMEGFFNLVEFWMPDWRENARKFYGARGVMAPIHSTTHGVTYCRHQFWTSGAGWLASYFYDYYRFTGDKDFLARRAMPLMKEIALFYEDFLFEDESGRYRLSPSFSPESGWRDNATMEIAVARELMKNLIAACQQLGVEQENLPKWQAMLAKMPAYQIGSNGDLAEWADGSFLHVYGHRHLSPFYPLFRSFEFSPEGTPELWKAAGVAFEKKRAARSVSRDWPGIQLGEALLAQSAAYLGRGDIVEEILKGMTDKLYPSLFMYLPTRKYFSFDGVGAYPDIINRSLAFALDGTLDLLRAVPPGWRKGVISGILVRGQIRIDRLQWDQDSGAIDLELTSAIP